MSQKKLLTESWGLDFWPQKLVSQHCPQNSVSNCRKSDTSSLLFLGSHCTLWKRSQILWRERSKDDQGHVWEEQEGNRHCVSRVSHQNQNLRGSKMLIDIYQHHYYKLKPRCVHKAGNTPMMSMHGKVWKLLVSFPAFRDVLISYLKLPWYKLHTTQVADFQIWDKALSDDELLKVIAIILFCKNEVGSKYRIVNHWRTLCENQLTGQYFSIFQWSKDSNSSPTSQLRPGVNCAEVSNPQATTV